MTTTVQKTACCNIRVGFGDSGSLRSSTVPRIGSECPRRNNTATMTSSGTDWVMPSWSQRSGPSNQSCFLMSSSVRTEPRASPPTNAIGIERRPPISAAARAGTMRAVRPIGVMGPWRGPTTMAMAVASTEASTQLTAARNWGE